MLIYDRPSWKISVFLFLTRISEKYGVVQANLGPYPQEFASDMEEQAMVRRRDVLRAVVVANNYFYCLGKDFKCKIS